MGDRQTFYQILGVSENAESEEIRAAYLAKARKLHPDNFRNASKRDQTRSEESMRELNQAWSTLSNREKRSKYDLKLTSQKADNRNFPSSNRISYQEWTSEPTTKKTTPRYATKEEMELTWFAKLVKPLPIALMIVVVVVVAVIASTGIGSNEDSTRPIPMPTGTPIGCMDIVPGGKGQQVPCGNHDAIIWRIVPTGEVCPKDLTEIFNGRGGLFCFTRAGKS